MIPTFGFMTLALGFLLTVYGLGVLIWGVIKKSRACIESARLAMLLIFPLVSLSIIAMVILLLSNHFEVVYVYQVTDQSMPAYLRLTALWGGQSGSLLFWSWLLAGVSMVFSIPKRSQSSEIFPWAGLVLFTVLGFFLAMNLFIDNPFESFWRQADGSWVISMFQPSGGWALMPENGQGLNPLLRHHGMILHPPALYLGFVGFAVPFALAIGSLAYGRKDRLWLELARPWLLVAWVFLSLGLVLGMRWAYDVLGWGGYWGWDPVEVSALMPWLSATALMHTGILQRRHDGYKRWNIFLVMLTFCLVIFSVFVTRSGIISSIHAFAESVMAIPLLLLLVILILGSIGLLVFRWRDLQGTHEPRFGFNKEVLTLLTDLVLLSILAVCFLGVIYPLGSELFTGSKMTVGETWYERITGPLFFLLLLLMGICPLGVWGAVNFKRMKRCILILLPISLLFPWLVWLANVRNIPALFILWLAGFGVLLIGSEFISVMRRPIRHASGEGFRGLWCSIRHQTRQVGGLIIHLGIILLSIGIIGIEGLQQETQVALSLGESASLAGYQFTYDGLELYTTDEEIEITEAVLIVTRAGKDVGILYPQKQVYPSLNQSIMQPGIKSTLAVDIYAVMINGNALTEEEATFVIYVNPLVAWLWVGAGVLTAGTVVAALPEEKKARLAD